MTDRLVQQHAGPAGAHHHRQSTGRRRNRLQVDQRLAQRLAGIALGTLLAVVIEFEEVAIVAAPATTVTTALAAAVVLDDHADVETHQRTDVGAQAAIAGGHQHMVPDSGQAHGDLLDARIEAASEYINALEQLDLLGALQHFQRVVLSIQRHHRRAGEGLHAALLAGAGNRAGGARRLAQGLGMDGVAVGEAGLLAGLGAHANALVEVEAAFLDDAVLQHPGLGDLALEVQIGGVDAGAGQFAEDRRQLLDGQVAGAQQMTADAAEDIAHGCSVGAGPGCSGAMNRL